MILSIPQEQKSVTVYGLASTKDSNIRYIGQTVQKLGDRLATHVNFAKKQSDVHIHRWIKSEVSNGYRIKIDPLITDATWSKTEIEMISLFRKNGHDLVNGTIGGDGVVGRNHTEDTKRKISNTMKGRCPKFTPEWKEKFITLGKEARARMVMSEEGRKKISQTHKGKKMFESNKKILLLKNKEWWAAGGEPVEKMKLKCKIASTGVKKSQETIDKLSKSTKLAWERRKKDPNYAKPNHMKRCLNGRFENGGSDK